MIPDRVNGYYTKLKNKINSCETRKKFPSNKGFKNYIFCFYWMRISKIKKKCN